MPPHRHIAAARSRDVERNCAQSDQRCTANLPPAQAVAFDRALTKLLTGASAPHPRSMSIAVPPGYLFVLDGMMGELETRLGLGGFFPASIQLLLRVGLGQQYEEHTDCDPYLAIEGIGSSQRFERLPASARDRRSERLPAVADLVRPWRR